MKRINEVPVIEELGENSYVLVDNDGAAARIAGSKVGGGGGDLPMLYYGSDGNSSTSVFYDKDFTQPVNSADGIKILTNRPAIWKESDDGEDLMYVTLLYLKYYSGGNYIRARIAGGEDWDATQNDRITLYFSDSVAD